MLFARVLLTLWAGLNFLVAAFVTLSTVLGQPPPALAIHSDPVAVVKAQAALANPLIMAVTAWVLLLTWRRPNESAVPLALTLVPIQAFGFVSDHFIGNANLTANLISSALLLVGLIFLRRRTP